MAPWQRCGFLTTNEPESVLWVKLLAVFCLVIYHVYCGRLVKAIEADTDRHSHVYFRVFNEVPVLFLFLIVILAVLKPF